MGEADVFPKPREDITEARSTCLHPRGHTMSLLKPHVSKWVLLELGCCSESHAFSGPPTAPLGSTAIVPAVDGATLLGDIFSRRIPGSAAVKNPPANACGRRRRLGFHPWVRKIPLGGGDGNPLQYSHLENPMDRRAWRATVHRVTSSQI